MDRQGCHGSRWRKTSIISESLNLDTQVAHPGKDAACKTAFSIKVLFHSSQNCMLAARTFTQSQLGVHRIVIFTIRPDTGFAGYLKKIRPDYPAGYCPDILFNLNTGMSSKKDQIHLSASYICHVKLFVKT